MATLTLKNGSTGSDVQRIQMILNEIYGSTVYGSRIVVDGIFGNATEGLVRQYQQDHGLVVDGIVGSATWTALTTHFSQD